MAHAVYTTTPNMGVDVTQAASATLSDFRGLKPAMKVAASDGRTYILAVASAGIAQATAIIVTPGTGSAAAGAGNFLTPASPFPAVTTGQYFWALSATA